MSPAKLADALRAQARALDAIADAIASCEAPAEHDPIVRVVAHVGAAAPRRVANAACAGGAIAGAVKRGKIWVARRSAIDAWLTRESAPRASADAIVARFEGRAA